MWWYHKIKASLRKKVKHCFRIIWTRNVIWSNLVQSCILVIVVGDFDCAFMNDIELRYCRFRYSVTQKHEVTILFNVFPKLCEAFRCVCSRSDGFANCYWLFFFSLMHPDSNNHVIPDKARMIWYLTSHEERTCLPISSWSMTLWMILKTV